MTAPTAHELWRLAGGGTRGYSADRYRELLREHGLLLPGAPEPLPCGWPVVTRDTWTPEEGA